MLFVFQNFFIPISPPRSREQTREIVERRRFTGPIKPDRERNFSPTYWMCIYIYKEERKRERERNRIPGGWSIYRRRRSGRSGTVNRQSDICFQPTDPPIPRYTIRYACRHPVCLPHTTLVIPLYDVDGGGKARGKTRRMFARGSRNLLLPR